MRPSKHKMLSAVIGVSLLTFATSANAIILYGTSYRNKSAPTGTIANSGWQWQGNWGGFTGTPIAKNYFITASHVGGNVGQKLSLAGKNYTASAFYDDPNSDLRIWKTTESFTSWAPLNTTQTETGKSAVLFGRGTARGAEVRVNNQLKGWKWAQQDGVLSWGTNKIDTTYNAGGGYGSFLKFAFDKSGGSNEGILSSGDSSGAVFVNNGGWKLAAINFSVDGPYSNTSGGATYLGALFDTGGLYFNNSLVADTVADKPVSAYASRISTNIGWINNVLAGRVGSGGALPGAAVPEPASVGLQAAAGMLVSRRFRYRK